MINIEICIVKNGKIHVLERYYADTAPRVGEFVKLIDYRDKYYSSFPEFFKVEQIFHERRDIRSGGTSEAKVQLIVHADEYAAKYIGV